MIPLNTNIEPNFVFQKVLKKLTDKINRQERLSKDVAKFHQAEKAIQEE